MEKSTEYSDGDTESEKDAVIVDSDGYEDSYDESVIVNYQYIMMAFAMAEAGTHDGMLMLIDTCSKFYIIKNPKMAVNVRRNPTTMKEKSNGGHQISKFKADLPEFFEVRCKNTSMLNILLWVDMHKYFRITVNTHKENCINTHLFKKRVMKFKEIEAGLYIWSPIKAKVAGVKRNNKAISAYSFLNFVAGNKKTPYG